MFLDHQMLAESSPDAVIDRESFLGLTKALILGPGAVNMHCCGLEYVQAKVTALDLLPGRVNAAPAVESRKIRRNWQDLADYYF